MGRIIRGAGLVTVVCGTALVALEGCEKSSQAQQAAPAREGPSAARGQYLVNITVCNDCHTPFKMGEHGPEPDMNRMLSGHPQLLQTPPAPAAVDSLWIAYIAATNTAFAGPWGVSYTANLTPDQRTGLGRWTEQMFIDAMRKGKHMGADGERGILPPMPWPWYAKMTDDDLKSIWMYLKTIPAIDNEVPQAVVAMPPG